MYSFLSLSSLSSTVCFLLLTPIFLSASEITEFEESYNVNNCAELIKKGINTSGIYNLNVNVWQGRKKIQVYCDMETKGGGWTVLQRRTERYGHRIYFNRTFTDYKTGFGDLAKEFWLGNDNIHILTAADDLMLRVELEYFSGEEIYAEYEEFFVENIQEGYKLFIGNYSGNAGDAMSENNLNLFYTYDHDNTNECAHIYKSGWWHDPNVCSKANLNGVYSRRSDGVSIFWNRSFFSFWKEHRRLKTVEMKVRPLNFKLK